MSGSHVVEVRIAAYWRTEAENTASFLTPEETEHGEFQGK